MLFVGEFKHSKKIKHSKKMFLLFLFIIFLFSYYFIIYLLLYAPRAVFSAPHADSTAPCAEIKHRKVMFFPMLFEIISLLFEFFSLLYFVIKQMA